MPNSATGTPAIFSSTDAFLSKPLGNGDGLPEPSTLLPEESLNLSLDIPKFVIKEDNAP